MPNQVIVTTLQVNASADRKLPSLDPVNVANFACEFSDEKGIDADPKSFVLQPSASKTIAFISAKTRFVMVKSDVPLTLQFASAGPVIPITTFLALSGDILGLGAFVLTNTSSLNAANIQVFEVGE